jgi:N-acetylmuramoyl-L-alanine amidase
MKILTAASPNFAVNEIVPEFIVLHYTACNCERALAIFASRERKVCAHFVLDTNGDLYDLGQFWDGPILQGAHAGISHYQLGNRKFEKLNVNSIGIEIVNVNGNLLPYTNEQYDSLAEILLHLGLRFPVLADPERIIGHEHIAGFRGKVDPGLEFDWNRVFKSVFGNGEFPPRLTVVTQEQGRQLQERLKATPPHLRTDQFWSDLSANLEQEFAAK